MRLAIVLAAIALLAPLAVAQDTLVFRTYDVSILTAPRVHRMGPRLGARISWRGGVDREIPEPREFLSGDALADLIRDTISEETWDEGGDVHYREGGVLIVKAPAHVQKLVEAFVKRMEAAASRRILFGVEVLEVPTGEYANVAGGSEGLGGALAPGKAKRTASVSLEAYPGVRSSVKVTNRVRYVADYDVEIAQGSNISDPIVMAAEDGLVLDLVGHLNADGSRVVVEALVQNGRFDRPFRTVELNVDEEYFAEPFRSPIRKNLGIMQLPTYRHADLHVTRVLRTNGSFAIPVLTKGKLLVFRVKAELLGGTGAAAGIIDLGALTGDILSPYFGFSAEDQEREFASLVAPSIFAREKQSRRARYSHAEELMDLLVQNVSPELWEERNASVNVNGESQLFVRAAGDVLADVRRFFAAREAGRLLNVALDIRLYSATGAVRAGPGKDAPPGSSLLYAGAVTTLPGARASVMVGNTMNFLADYDVEVAQEARIADPIVGQSFEGLVANLLPRLSMDRSRLTLEVEMLVAERLEGEPFETKAQFLGPIDTISENRSVLNDTVEMPTGGLYAIDLGPDPTDTNRRLVVVIRNRVE